MKRGVLFVGHGSRERAGNEQFLALSAQVGVQPCFLGHASPTIQEAIDAMAVADIVVVPLFLFEAGHLKRDLPAALAEAGRRRPGLRFRVAGPLGLEPRLVQIAASHIHPDDTVLLVGRGASDPSAREGLFAVGRLLQAETGCAGVVPAFCDVAAPGLEEGLAACLAGGARRVAVLPYLLFRGVLLDRVAKLVDRWESEHPGVAISMVGADGLAANCSFPDLIFHQINRLVGSNTNPCSDV